jgi:predicted nucleic acid-binding protein
MVRILDTNVLINHFRRLDKKQRTAPNLKAHAQTLIEFWGTNFIVSPVLIEFLAGARTSEELKLFKAYLEPFDVLDKGDIPRQDWDEAKRLAQWIRKTDRRRKLGDCLIIAITKRLGVDPITSDPDFKQRIPAQ